MLQFPKRFLICSFVLSYRSVDPEQSVEAYHVQLDQALYARSGLTQYFRLGCEYADERHGLSEGLSP